MVVPSLTLNSSASSRNSSKQVQKDICSDTGLLALSDIIFDGLNDGALLTVEPGSARSSL